MSLIQDSIMTLMDPGPSKEVKGRNVGDKIDNYEMKLSSGRVVFTDDLLKSGPLLLIFIRGTWCPFCRMHLKRVRDWMRKLEKSKKGTVVIISSEEPEVIRDWLAKNPMSTMFAGDPTMKMAKDFGVYLDPREFSQAATFLIDADKSIRLAYLGNRTEKNFKVVEDSLA